MNYTIEIGRKFAKEMKRLGKKYRSLKSDYANLIDELHANPLAGTDLGNGVRKVRMAIASKNRGKSHGARVITFNYVVTRRTAWFRCLPSMTRPSGRASQPRK